MQDLEFTRTQINDLLITSNKSYEQHLEHFETVFTRLKTTGLKVNLTKSKLCRAKLEYLGYWITRQGVQIFADAGSKTIW